MNKGTTKYPSSAVRRKYPKSKKKQDTEHAKQYPHEIKSPKPNEHNNLFKYYFRKEFEGLIRFPNGRKHSKTQGHRPSCCIVFEW